MSAISCSGSVIAGMPVGGGSSKAAMSSWPGRAVAAAPAAHSASRRGRSKQSNAPAVASASTWSADSPTRRARSAIEVNGPSRSRDATIASASSVADRAHRRQPQPHRRLRRVEAGALRRARSPGSSEAPASEQRQRGLAHLDAVPLRVVHQRLRRVEAHRLRVEQRRAERGGVVQLEPGRRVDQQREADRVRLGEAERGERLDLLVDLVGDRAGDAVGCHPVVEADSHRVDLVAATASSPSPGAAGRPRTG